MSRNVVVEKSLPTPGRCLSASGSCQKIEELRGWNETRIFY